jgi:hypothetical protein
MRDAFAHRTTDFDFCNAQGLRGDLTKVGSDQFQISYVGGTGNDLVVTAIPEPSTTAIIAGIGVLVFTVLRRRRAVAA